MPQEGVLSLKSMFYLSLLGYSQILVYSYKSKNITLSIVTDFKKNDKNFQRAFKTDLEKKRMLYQQVRTNIALADTLIPSSFLYLIYMGGTGPCNSIKIIFGYHVNSKHIILNIKFGVNRMFHVVKTPVYRFDLYGRYRTLWTDDDNF